jgi:hypothetical protein
VPDADERAAFTACLAGVADDAGSPLRVIVSMRSDFLDRVAEDTRFMEELTSGLIFLQPPDRRGLEEALVQPVEMVGYGFEDPEMVVEMLDALETTPGALPLLQFAAARLWEDRDRSRKLLTRDRYSAMGGIAGALASHADQVLASLAPSVQKLARAIFLRLVTPEGTRAIVEVSELGELSSDPHEVQRLVDHMVHARLLVVQTRTEEQAPAIEIVHESLIDSWPTLRRWLDESHEDTAFIAQLRTAAKQWEQKGRARGLLWRGEAVREARHWHRRATRELPRREQAYLDAAFALANRARRVKRIAVVGTIVFLAAIAVAAGIALLSIREAERDASEQAELAKEEASKARAAEAELSERVDELEREKHQRQEAQQDAQLSRGELKTKNEELEKTLGERETALAERETALANARSERERAQSAQARAETSERDARKANKNLQDALARERKEKQKLQQKLDGLTTKLK